jgi:MFS family permease
VLVIGTVVFVDTMFYAVIAPLLPVLSHQLHLTKLSAGVLTASYAIGTFLGSLPGGVLAARFGPRATVCTGLALMGASTLAFGLAGSVLALDCARFVEGVGGACSWAGGLAWIVAETPVAQRGAMIGRALAAGIGGSLLGPGIGSIGAAVGRGALFTGLTLVAAVLIAATRRLPVHPVVGGGQGVSSLLAVLRRRRVLAAMWLMGLPAIVSGAIGVLGPLRMHQLGAGAFAIGATYVAGAGLEAGLSPVIGGISDRFGRLAPLRGGLAAASVTLLCFTLPASALALAAVIVLVAAALGAFWAPAMAMLSDVGERFGLDQGLAAALMNLAWAGGQIIGSGGSGAVAKAAGDFLPTAAVAGLCALTLAATAISAQTRP